MKYFFMIMRCMIIVSLCLMPSCRPLHWAKKKVVQVDKVPLDKAVIKKQYMRAVRAYSQFDTQLFVDALWLSPEVRSWYVAEYGRARGVSDEAQSLMLRKQLAENYHFISFYVASYIPPGYDTIIWSDKEAPWSLRLVVGDTPYEPVSVKIVDMPPEYATLFGAAYNKHRTKYLVQFNAHNEQREPLITADTPFSLYCATTGQHIVLQWNTP